MWQIISVHISTNTSVFETQLSNRLKFTPRSSHTGSSICLVPASSTPMLTTLNDWQFSKHIALPHASLPQLVLSTGNLPESLLFLPNHWHHTSLKFSFVLFSFLQGFKDCPYFMPPKAPRAITPILLLTYYIVLKSSLSSSEYLRDNIICTTHREYVG